MSDLGPHDTVLCTAMMGFGSLRTFIESAGAAGFSAISIAIGDYKEGRASGLSHADIRSLLADNGVRVAELDGIVTWLRPLPIEQGEGYGLDHPFFGPDAEEFFAMAAALRARSVTVVDPFAGTAPLDQMVEAFASACDRAAEQGLLVHLEFLSWGPVANLATAWDIVRLADRPNGGIMLDTLHLMRSGSRELLAKIPSERIFATQFCDGTAERISDPFSDAANRLWLCEGQFDLAGILREVRANGCTAPLGIEVMNDESRAMAPVDIAKRAFESLSRLKQQAQSS